MAEARGGGYQRSLVSKHPLDLFQEIVDLDAHDLGLLGKFVRSTQHLVDFALFLDIDDAGIEVAVGNRLAYLERLGGGGRIIVEGRAIVRNRCVCSSIQFLNFPAKELGYEDWAANLYPNPVTVMIISGLRGFGSIFLRKRLTMTSTTRSLAVSP